MKALLRRNEQLSFTLVVYALLVVIAGSYFLVRETKETYAKLREGPSVLGLYPSAVVPMARQRVSLLSEGSHFGPETTITSSVPSVFFSSLRFVGQEDLSFEICVLDASLKEGSEIPLTISSPLPGGLKEKVELKLELTHELKPLSLELFNFEGLDEATVYSEHVLFGYKPKGYAPYTFMAIHLRSGAVYSQETESELEHLGAPVKKGENAFELIREHEFKGILALFPGCAGEKGRECL